MKRYLKKFSEISAADTALAGVKAAFMADLYNLDDPDMKVPEGFVLTSEGFDYFLEYNAIEGTLLSLTEKAVHANFESIEEISKSAKKLLFNARFPVKLEIAINRMCESLFDTGGQPLAVRSSSYYQRNGEPCGMESYLNISGNVALIYAIKCCFASYFNTEAITCRAKKGITGINLSVILQKMAGIHGISGTARSLPPLVPEGHRTISIKGNNGLGSNLLEGVSPDEFIVNSSLLRNSSTSGIVKIQGKKTQMLVTNDNASGINSVTLKLTPGELRERFILEDEEAITLAKAVVKTASYYNSDVCLEWAKEAGESFFNIVGLQVMPA
ncbi:hypothetical protein CHU92_03690 [Flavobacterium cyanobacteriorum]|uniref:Phosphoenolpyruvate synthase n=1 Tax=Flavobacterium cyanobacteriorum TaxID=2022802 RepID=A0A255ZNI0_9FLAO|nr:PEP/pyruvate-binding domain-containing protein [Flavobacterium cyanobacteriorum]OYQ43073.1 hypothetical protein CHU92_03690 [Flavobacterium cyanobacteriorum]